MVINRSRILKHRPALAENADVFYFSAAILNFADFLKISEKLEKKSRQRAESKQKTPKFCLENEMIFFFFQKKFKICLLIFGKTHAGFSCWET